MNSSDEQLVSRGTLEKELEHVQFRREMADRVIDRMQNRVPFLEREIRIPVPVAALSLVLVISTALLPILSDDSPASKSGSQRMIVTESGVFAESLLNKEAK